MPAKIKCVIFDFDDTLVFSKQAFEKARQNCPEHKILRKYGFKYTKKQVLQATLRMEKKAKLTPLKKRIKDPLFHAKIFEKELGIEENKKIAKECENAFFQEREKFLKLLPNAKKTLKALKQKKILLCVITNAQKIHNKNAAKKLQIMKYFKIFMNAKEHGMKNELKIFKQFLKKINKNRKEKIQPSECLMIGNHAGEDGAAKLVGMKVALLKPTLEGHKHLKTLKPDYLIKDLKEIERIVFENGIH